MIGLYRVVRRTLAAWLIAGLAGCSMGAMNQPDVLVAVPHGVSDTVGLRLAVSLADILTEHGIAAQATANNGRALRQLKAVIETESNGGGIVTLRIAWTLFGREGKRLGGYVQYVQAPQWQWEAGDADVISSAAAVAASPLGNLIRNGGSP